MTFATFVERAAMYLYRFAVASQNLGFRAAVETFWLVRGGSEVRSVYSPRLGRSIFFRSGADKGVMSHFFFPGTRLFDTPVCPVRVIVDAGANAGMETIRMRHFFPQARVFCIEPATSNYSILQQNAAQDKGMVETTNHGLWSTEGGLRVLPGTTNEAFSVRPAEPGEPVDIEAITMNKVLAHVGGEIDILKMDIEGTEFEIFSRNAEWVNHVKAFVFECPDADHAGATAQIYKALEGLPFDTAVSGENIVLIRRDTGWRVETTQYL